MGLEEGVWVLEIRFPGLGAWCSLSKHFADFSVQDLCLNWSAFIFSV